MGAGKQTVEFVIEEPVRPVAAGGLRRGDVGRQQVSPQFFVVASRGLALVVIAPRARSRGVPYRYPLTIRFVS